MTCSDSGGQWCLQPGRGDTLFVVACLLTLITALSWRTDKHDYKAQYRVGILLVAIGLIWAIGQCSFLQSSQRRKYSNIVCCISLLQGSVFPSERYFGWWRNGSVDFVHLPKNLYRARWRVSTR